MTLTQRIPQMIKIALKWTRIRPGQKDEKHPLEDEDDKNNR